jgi:tetratricopeptide (TPR) repeat protein
MKAASDVEDSNKNDCSIISTNGSAGAIKGNGSNSESEPMEISASNPAQSIKSIQIGSDLGNAELWNRKGVSLAKAGQHNEAYECFERALKLDPNHEGAWVNKGKAILALSGREVNRDRDAIMCFDRALELKPIDADAWYLKGVALARMEMMEDALVAYQRSIEIEPDHAGSWYGMGLAARHFGYKKRAEECFKTASKLGLKPKK